MGEPGSVHVIEDGYGGYRTRLMIAGAEMLGQVRYLNFVEARLAAFELTYQLRRDVTAAGLSPGGARPENKGDRNASNT